MSKRISELPQAVEITDGQQLPVDDTITERITIAQLVEYVINQLPPAAPGADILQVQVFS